MVDYGRIRSTVRPEKIEVDAYSVWINTKIEEVEVTDEGDTRTEYEYHQVRYTKEEYLKQMIGENREAENLMNTILGVKE